MTNCLIPNQSQVHDPNATMCDSTAGKQRHDPLLTLNSVGFIRRRGCDEQQIQSWQEFVWQLLFSMATSTYSD